MSGPGFCGLGAEGRGGERAGDWPARPWRPVAAGSSELLATGPSRARKSSLGPFPGRFGDATALSQASLFLWGKDAKWQLGLLPDPSGSHGSAQASLTEKGGWHLTPLCLTRSRVVVPQFVRQLFIP